MSDVPSNLIPTRVTQLPVAPVADENSLMMIVYQGNNYQIRVGDLLSVAGVPITRQVIAGTGMQGGGQLSSNVTLSIAPGGVGNSELSQTGVTPGVYGSSFTVPVLTVDAQGRVAAASSTGIAGSAGGTVVSVGLSLPSEFTVTGSPVTYSGTFNGAWAVQAANLVLASPNSASGTPSFRALVNGDIPAALSGKTITSSTVDGSIIGGSTPAAGTFTTATATDVNATTVDATNLEVTNLKAKDGTAAASIADSTGAVTVSTLLNVDNLRLDGNTLSSTDANGNITLDPNGTGEVAIPAGIDGPLYVDFNITQNPLPATATGRLYYNNEDQFRSLTFQMDAGTTQHVGMDQFFRVKCQGSITKGQVVSFAGAVGASGGLIGKAATGLTPQQANYILGVATESGVNNDWIFVCCFGEVKGIDTTGGAEAWVQGQELYYDPAVTGGLTKTKPTSPNAICTVAAVVHVGVSNGILYVRPTFGSVLGGTDGNVQFSTLNNGDVIVYDSVDQRWENVAQSSLSVGSASTATSATTATNLAGGAASQIPYQTGAGATTFLANGTAGQVLLSNGASAPSWGSVSGGTF